ncbi:helix-turn-helix transcriptional regulator [Sulfitobacter sp.]|uniref:helix-turn-helix transcriptional regulator n=1 Tax=Sulfitobacter sp. TaxID=1903071 RepID=UPI0030023E7A
MPFLVAPYNWSAYDMNTTQPNANTFDQLLTVKQVAERAAISVASVWRLTKTGDLPQPVRIGRSVRWRESDLRKHIQTSA